MYHKIFLLSSKNFYYFNANADNCTSNFCVFSYAKILATRANALSVSGTLFFGWVSGITINLLVYSYGSSNPVISTNLILWIIVLIIYSQNLSYSSLTNFALRKIGLSYNF